MACRRDPVRALGEQDGETSAWKIRRYATAFSQPPASQSLRYAVAPHNHRQFDICTFQPTAWAVAKQSSKFCEAIYEMNLFFTANKVDAKRSTLRTCTLCCTISVACY